MNCHELEPVLSDLARNQMMDASLRERALSHAESCASCAAWLADERALAAELKCLAASYERDGAPPRVEESIIAAFRDQTASPVGPRAVTRRWFYIAASVAAAALIVMLLSLTISRTRQSHPRSQESAKGGEVPTTPESPKLANRSSDLSAGLESRKHKATEAVKNPVRPKRRAPSSDQLVADVEIATDFIPLRHGESL